jgi:hypothetical protein
MQSKAATVKEYLAELPDDRRKALEAVRKVVRKNLDKAYVEGMQYGMVGYYVPHKVYPPGYHCDPKQPLPFAGMASQKNHMSLYLFCVYNNPELLAWFQKAVAKSGKKLDMGKSCIRFKKLEDLPLEVIGEAVRRVPVKDFVAHYEKAILTMNRQAATRRAAKKKTAAKKVVKKKVAKKTVAKKPATKKKATTKNATTKKVAKKKPAPARSAKKKRTANKTPAKR